MNKFMGSQGGLISAIYSLATMSIIGNICIYYLILDATLIVIAAVA
ncbi:MAG: hypothetical protein QXN16_01355 [Candidatus Micrarchaeaceae archaeon]